MQYLLVAEQGDNTAASNAAFMLQRGQGFHGPGHLELAAFLYERWGRACVYARACACTFMHLRVCVFEGMHVCTPLQPYVRVNALRACMHVQSWALPTQASAHTSGHEWCKPSSICAL